MSELRWNPVLREWTITATHRQDRTFKPPKDYCPFCPPRDDGVPTAITEDDFDVAVVENGFPSLQENPPEPAVDGDDHHPVEPAEGVCEVVLYTSDHDTVASELPASKFRKLAAVWADRYEELGARDEVEYVFLFENKGEEMGVTLEHPHGQIYAYPFVPPTIERELASSASYHEEHGECLFCDLIAAEVAADERVVAENDSFAAVVPFSARYAYEVHVYAKEHRPSIADLSADERADLGDLLKRLLVAYDDLFGFEMPYVMSTHQQPTDGTGEEYAHYHLEFYPPYRTADKLKYLAGSERGAGTFINNKLPEEAASELAALVPESVE
jgi:UDPglucose--hexose-1-phosphate uridylyltransferase